MLLLGCAAGDVDIAMVNSPRRLVLRPINMVRIQLQTVGMFISK